MTHGLLPITRSQLLRTLTDDPALPALIAKMDAPTLKRLVERVGPEDSGALIALTRPEQLAELLDDALWKVPEGAVEESLSVEELLRWFDVFHDVSHDFAADRLVDLGEEFCAMSFAQLIYVSDKKPHLDEFSAVFDEYVVRARFEDEWDTIHAALLALWTAHPDFLVHMLGALTPRHSILGNDDAPRRLHADEAGARSTRRRRTGFVEASDAAAWLALVRVTPLDALVGARAYDPLTDAYFRSVAGAPKQPSPEPDDEPTMEVHVTDAEIDALQAMLDRAQVTPVSSAARLTGPEPRSADGALRAALARLQTRSPDAFAARMRELGYVSNALVSTVRFSGKRFTEESAANAAMATCHLGATYLGGDARDAHFDHVLTAEPGLVRAFAVGLSLIDRLPTAVAGRIGALFEREDVRERVARKPWVLAEVDALLANDALLESVRERDLEDAKDTLSLLAIALKPEACVCLRVLVDEFPAFPRVLEQADRTAVVGESSRVIATLADLARIEAFLAALAEAVKL